MGGRGAFAAVPRVSGSAECGILVKLQNFYDLECERRAGKASEIERQVQPVGAE